MCECIKTVNEKLKNAGTNTRLDIPTVMSFSDNSLKSEMASIATCKIDSKNRKKAQTVFSAFCPFCGEKYGE